VAKLDRLSRDVHFISGLMAERVQFQSSSPSWVQTWTPSSSICLRRWWRRSAR
jgi:hypothetical protein